MSVYRPKRSSLFVYDFIHEGRRFHGPTGQKDRRSAEVYERRKRREIAGGQCEGAFGADISLDIAAGEWWQETGRTLRSAASVEHRLEVLLRCLDPKLMVSRIRTAHVNEAINRRLALLTRGRPPAPGTVNRDIIDTLRPILRRAARIHEIRMPTIDWKALRKKEPDEIVREFTPDEIGRWSAELDEIERLFLDVALTYGMRLGEMFFAPDAVRVDPRPAVVVGRYKGRDGWRDRRKDGSKITMPLKLEHAVSLARLAGSASEAGLDVVWAEEAAGCLKEITYWGMRSRLVTGAARAGIEPGRIIHGMRHHAGTTLLRRTGNIALVQRLLGHKQIATTQRYAHVNEDDLRAAIESLPATSQNNKGRRPPANSRRSPPQFTGKSPTPEIVPGRAARGGKNVNKTVRHGRSTRSPKSSASASSATSANEGGRA